MFLRYFPYVYIYILYPDFFPRYVPYISYNPIFLQDISHTFPRYFPYIPFWYFHICPYISYIIPYFSRYIHVSHMLLKYFPYIPFWYFLYNPIFFKIYPCIPYASQIFPIYPVLIFPIYPTFIPDILYFLTPLAQHILQAWSTLDEALQEG